MPKLVRRFLFRAPLLPLGATSLDESPLGGLALRLASATLALGDPSAAIRRYVARARFRPTPAGLFAGVGVGRLGRVTRAATGAPRPHLTIAHARLAAIARTLLDDEESRARVKLRVAPSLLEHGDHVMWLAPDGEAAEAIVDDTLAPVLAAARAPAPWTRLARVAPDDLLLSLVDDGLLVSDLSPPVVGPPPLAWMRARLARLATAAASAARATLDVETAAPGDTFATLLFPEARVTLDEAVVARAAALAPLLARLGDALAPPAAERELDPSIAAAADAAHELVGPGALPLAPFALGGYGVRPGDGAARPPAEAPRALLALLVEKLVAAAAAGAPEIALSAAELDAVLPDGEAPSSFELTLAPRAAPDDWLLGLHAPAGATWGRFAHALGAPLARALAELVAAEGGERLDVVFAPAGLADLAAHPPVRRAALALTGFPAGAAVVPAELAVVAPAPLALDGPTPSPLTRLRSQLAPPGVYQLLAGWSLRRQHAPWAMVWGPLADQAWLPRVVLDGFVIAPASWRLPTEPLDAWRARLRVPRWVQVGREDELLLVDLDTPDAARELARAGGRAHEVWPPLDDPPVDADGRRLEVVVAVAGPEPRRRAAARAAPPAAQPPVAGWRTFRIHGPRDRQDRVLLEAVAPTIAEARAAGEISGWFYLRYVDGARHHLRLRVRGDARAVAARLDAALAPAIAAGDVVTVDEGPYHREQARYASAPVEAAFERDSDAALALLAGAEDLDAAAVSHIDRLAAELGLDLAARHALATRLRAAFEPYPEDAAVDFRRRAAALRRALGGTRTRRPKHRLPVADLIHLSLNRLDPELEGRAVYLWQRALEGLLATR